MIRKGSIVDSFRGVPDRGYVAVRGGVIVAVGSVGAWARVRSMRQACWSRPGSLTCAPTASELARRVILASSGRLVLMTTLFSPPRRSGSQLAQTSAEIYIHLSNKTSRRLRGVVGSLHPCQAHFGPTTAR